MKQVRFLQKLFIGNSECVWLCGGETDGVDAGRQTRGMNKREDDNEAKQWGQQSWEMDGGRERQRQKKGRERKREEKKRGG